jgi:RNA polymerase sigma factor (sigma-70 family)
MSNPFQQETDEALVIHYKVTGDKNAIGILFKRHTLMCFAVCNKYLRDEDSAQDAVMQVFEKLFTDLLKHEVINFKSWLHSVCRNHCLMQLRKPDLMVRMDDSEGDRDSYGTEVGFMELNAFLHQDDNDQDKESQLRLMEEALGGLNEKQKSCLQLFYLERKSYEEVALLTGMSMKEVKSSIQNGKRNLKIILNNKGIALLFVLAECLLQNI